MENLNKNGSFVQRRKMYVEFPFHNLSSKIPIDWSSEDNATLERQRKLQRERQEQEYIRKIYNNRIEQKLQQKFRIGPDNHRNPSENSSRNSKDVLQQEVENFNHSKILTGPPARANPQILEYRKNEDLLPQNYGGSNHYDKSNQQYQQYEKEQIQYERPPVQRQRMGSQLERQNQYQKQQNRPELPERDIQEQHYLSQSQNNEYRQSYDPQSGTPKNYQRDRYASLHSPGYRLPDGKRSESTQVKREPLYMPKNYPYDLVKDHRRYADLLPPSEDPEHPFRNIMPDKLENFLREKTKADRKSAIVPTLVTRRQLGY